MSLLLLARASENIIIIISIISDFPSIINRRSPRPVMVADTGNSSKKTALQ